MKTFPDQAVPREPSGLPDPLASRWPAVVLALVALLAVGLRVRMLLLGRSLWLDEAMLALNISGRSFGELMKPLAYDQAAPIGFLFAERVAVLALGPTELALRLVPFLASLASLALIYRLGSANFGRWAGVVGVALAGVAPALVYYAGELKQYSSDVAAAALILALTADALRLGLSPRRAAVLALVGSAATWVSHPAIFVLAGAGGTLFVQGVRKRRPAVAALSAVVGACWLASFATQYVLFLRALGSNAYLAEYWESGFLRFPPRSPGDLRLYPAIGFGIFEALFPNAQVDVDLAARMGVFTAAAWLVGVVVLFRRGQGEVLALLVAPLVFAVLASMLHLYPLKSRLALFTAAATIPVIAAGCAGLLTAREPSERAIGAVLLGCALLLPAMQGAQLLLERPRLHDARGVLSSLAQDWRPGDLVVIDRFSAPPFEYYQAHGRVDRLDQVRPTLTDRVLTEPEGLLGEIRRRKGVGRVWFVLDTALPDPANFSRDALRVLLDSAGQRLASYSSRRYSAHLYRLD